MQKPIARFYIPVCNIVVVFSYFIKLSPTNDYLLTIYGLVDNYVRDQCHITLSLYKTDTSLRWTVEADPEGVERPFDCTLLSSKGCDFW